ncbi:MAG: hypothetical protein JNJ57_05120 [Saprospiraceae bacterium]|nr:hypothetical protein [Saprospiraceae bacterium]
MQRKNVFFTLLIFFLAAGSIHAQKAPREVGLQFNGLDFGGYNSFSAFFKKQKSEQVYKRIRFFVGEIDFQVFNETATFGLNGGIAIGREKRKQLDDKLMFYQGPEFSGGLGFRSFSEDDFSANFSARFGWVVGLQHSFNDKWAVNMEAIPGLGAILLVSDDVDTQFSITGRVSNSVNLGIVRKF